MDVSRLTITKETKEKMSKQISSHKKGELRWNKLKELEETGKLNSARNRKEVSAMLGLGNSFGNGYNWITKMIRDGYLAETLLGFDKYNKPEHEYHLIGKPKYKPGINGGRKAKETARIHVPEPVSLVSIPEANDKVRAIIRYKDITIEFENINDSIVGSIVEKIINR